ncbi:MAG: DNA-3-methyladenine glycosylase [Solirubrobacterales bacterium]|nr:DNA-3-methyladenine glycosylase [Solirubrobacterales bacterium]
MSRERPRHGRRRSTELEVAVRTPGPYRLPRSSSDRTLRSRGAGAVRLLHVEGSPVLVRAWQTARDRVVLRAQAVAPETVSRAAVGPQAEVSAAGAEDLQLAIERMRFALAVDVDLGEFQRRFRRDRLVGPLIRRMPDFRPARRPWAWEALASAIVGQLIEADRAARIERRIVGRWGPRLGEGREALRDVPAPATIAGRAPAELQSMELSGARAIALRRLARDVASGRCRVESSDSDRRLLATPEIGPWTVQCLGLFGRGDMDSLPAGDLGYIKLVGRLANLGRRATIAEVEEFYAPYEPFRGLVGALTLSGLHRAVAQGPPLRMAA